MNFFLDCCIIHVCMNILFGVGKRGSMNNLISVYCTHQDRYHDDFARSSNPWLGTFAHSFYHSLHRSLQVPLCSYSHYYYIGTNGISDHSPLRRTLLVQLVASGPGQTDLEEMKHKWVETVLHFPPRFFVIPFAQNCMLCFLPLLLICTICCQATSCTQCPDATKRSRDWRAVHCNASGAYMLH